MRKKNSDREVHPTQLERDGPFDSLIRVWQRDLIAITNCDQEPRPENLVTAAGKGDENRTRGEGKGNAKKQAIPNHELVFFTPENREKRETAANGHPQASIMACLCAVIHISPATIPLLC
ncbi:hypothetical protein FOXG_20332 [Fusarium oxysporum f. sp. lycopersici 4287]|uniref:Uncharacterized protein n=2 Tax=Fusarium oxysporum TaxID=5507 RepID=A0A0J9VHU5_FUSO4|nr:hypothetical protein FOXG_20332 [Fusarium oxysporum f. sp. lycopersici 4287]EXK40596.1 hypothetical protein FOMG_07383 [Fusarium oxysporum f. sp. melonis 26406]KNB10371.1 hypothetical protein FOXG_20332 [Fusarium oxysporum f. sp. lycopersici 4287]